MEGAEAAIRAFTVNLPVIQRYAVDEEKEVHTQNRRAISFQSDSNAHCVLTHLPMSLRGRTW